MSKKTVLITGGTGLVGSKLIPQLLERNFSVRVLSRSKQTTNEPNLSYFTWDIQKQTIEKGALEGVDTIIHLAGAGIADKKWTESRKKTIIDSRVESLRLLYNETAKSPSKPSKIISASGIGYYGAVTKEHVFKEEDSSGSDFVSEVCIKWENEAKQFTQLGMAYFIPRIAVVLSDKGGALDRIKAPTKFHLGAPLGHGNQYMPWIHIEDLVSIILFALENENITGIYNAVADEHVTNKQFSKQLAKALDKAFFLPNVPSFVLKVVFGEMANIILEGSRVSNAKIKGEGFQFKFNQLNEAFNDLFKQ